MPRSGGSWVTALSFPSHVIIKFLLTRGMRPHASSVTASPWAGLLQHPSWHLEPSKSWQEGGGGQNAAFALVGVIQMLRARSCKHLGL